MLLDKMVKVNKHHLLTREFWHSDVTVSQDTDDTKNLNNSTNANMIKRFLVYMELPKIKIGDYHKSSCVVGNVLRLHFLVKSAKNENETLRLLPIKVYKLPVVNMAVIHRSLIEDDTAKGPIPKSPDVKSPLIRYESEDCEGRDGGELDDNLQDDFRKLTAGAGSTTGADTSADAGAYGGADADADATADAAETTAFQYESEDNQDQRNGSKHRRRKRKKYFVYCELPKVAIGDYRISSVTSSDLIHCHFLMKIAKDEAHGQPALRPIKKYRRPRVNFAVIHRSLIVDDEAKGPIPRSPGIKSPMIREDLESEDDEEVLHSTMGFNYGAAAPKSKYELLTQWSLVTDEYGRVAPEVVLSKAGA